MSDLAEIGKEYNRITYRIAAEYGSRTERRDQARAHVPATVRALTPRQSAISACS